MLTGVDGVGLELDGSERFVINTIGSVKVVIAMAVPKISTVICLRVFFFLGYAVAVKAPGSSSSNQLNPQISNPAS